MPMDVFTIDNHTINKFKVGHGAKRRTNVNSQVLCRFGEGEFIIDISGCVNPPQDAYEL